MNYIKMASILFILFGIILIFLYIKFRALKHEKSTLLKERSSLNSILEDASIVVCVWDIEGNLIRFNKHAERITGFLEKEVVKDNWKRTIMLGSAQQEILEIMLKLKNREKNLVFKNVMTCKDARSIDMEFNCSILHDPNIIIAIGYDISEKKQVQQKLNASSMELEATQEELTATEMKLAQKYKELQENQSILRLREERYRLATEGTNDGLWDWDISENEIFISENCSRMLGFSGDEFNNKLENFLRLVHADDIGLLKTQFNEHINGNEDFLKAEIRLKTSDEGYKWILIKGKAVFDEEKNATRIVGSNTDITDRKDIEDKVTYMAYHDTLTGLPNRISSEKYLNEQLDESANSDNKIGVLALDLDNFKNINDTIGHTFGNKLLIAVAGLLKQLYKNEDGMFARIGGDEFMFILPYIKGEIVLKNLAENIIDILKAPIMIGEHEINITSSIGITIYPKDGKDSVTLLKNADTAMYSAKEVGKNNYQFFVKEMNILMLEKSKLEKDLRKAIKNTEFIVYYQPQINIMTGDVVGMEALVRWNSPTLGLVSPMNFIPIAEETGLIIPIGEFVLRTACRKNKEWQDKGYSPKRVAVNLSGKQFQQKNLIEVIESILEETQLEPQWLELEITESIAMQNLDYTLVVLKKLIAMGICISLDDFGTGFSSLNYLKILPINILKIDKSFVNDIDKNPKEAAIARAIISMAHSMALVIVAEGVEHIAQLEFLKDHGCDKAQGFLFSKPVTEEDFEKILNGKLLVDKY